VLLFVPRLVVEFSSLMFKRLFEDIAVAGVASLANRLWYDRLRDLRLIHLVSNGCITHFDVDGNSRASVISPG
jgi:hypothetical protein